MFLNWAGAKGSWRSRVLVNPADVTESVKRLASVGFWLPNLSSVRSSGTTRWLIRSMPTGCSTRSASDGSSLRNETSKFDPDGRIARQLLCLPSSPVRIGMTAIGGSVVSRLSPQVNSMPMSTEKNRKESDAVPLACHGVGPSRVNEMPTPNTPIPKTCTENEVEIDTLKWNGENWISASKPEAPSTDSAEN